VKLQRGEVFVKIGMFQLGPVNKIEVFLRFEERENFHAHRGENEVGVAGAASAQARQKNCQNEEGQWHPPSEGGVIHQPGDAQEQGKGEGDRRDDDESLSLSGAGETELFMRLGNFFWDGHCLKIAVVDAKGVALVDVAEAKALDEPAHALVGSAMVETFRLHALIGVFLQSATAHGDASTTASEVVTFSQIFPTHWDFLRGNLLDVDDVFIIKRRLRFLFLRRDARGDNMEFSFQALPQVPGENRAHRWNEEEEAEGIG
jgi:hypothetical protein